MVTTNAVRFPLANCLALVLMSCLFAFLFNVTTSQPGFVLTHDSATIQFTPLLHDTPIQTRPPKPIKPRVDQPPATPAIDRGVPDPLAHMPIVKIVDAPVLTSLTRGRIDRAETPIVRPDPDYPRRAQVGGIEGWVDVQFSVTPAGTVTDVVVIDAEPTGVFEAAATKAVLRWKYAPKVDDGRAVERRGMRVVLRFNLD